MQPNEQPRLSDGDLFENVALPAQPEPAPAQDPRPLKERLAGFLAGIKSGLKNGELEDSEYTQLVFREARAASLVQGDKFAWENAGDIGRLIYMLEKKLDIETHVGLEKKYQSLPKTALRQETQEDLSRYQELKRDTGVYLAGTYKKGQSIEESKFQDCVCEYVANWAVSHGLQYKLDSFQLAGLSGHMIGSYMDEYKMIKAPKQIGGTDMDEIDRELKNL